jgi:hypothetical protein
VVVAILITVPASKETAFTTMVTKRERRSSEFRVLSSEGTEEEEEEEEHRHARVECSSLLLLLCFFSLRTQNSELRTDSSLLSLCVLCGEFFFFTSAS